MSAHSWHDAHIKRARVSFARALYLTLGTFLALFVLFHLASALYVSSIATSSSDALKAGIAQELAYLKEQGDAVAANDSVAIQLLEDNTDVLLSILKEEQAARSIGQIAVVNTEGVLVSRTRKVGVQGDNLFLTSAEGRVVARGESVESIGQSILDPRQIRLSTGRPITSRGRMVGGLFAIQLIDDAYATHFRDTHLPGGTEVLFYNKEFGIYGGSITESPTRLLIDSYFNSGSTWVKDAASNKTISFADGRFYLVENTVFPGLEESSAGALLLIPRYDISNITHMVTALLTLGIFIFLALWQHYLRPRGEEWGWRYWVLLACVSIPVVILALLALRLQTMGYLKLERIPYTLYNSTLRLQPEFGIYDMDFEQRFSIIADTGDEAINAVQIRLLFDPAAVEVMALEAATSTCAYVIENTVDAVAGRADLSCVLLQSGGERGSLRIADVVVTPKRPGGFTLSFDSTETKVLASDGLGTNVLRLAQSGSYRADVFDLDISASSTSVGRSFVLFSPTHPNQSRWYNHDVARFVWRGRLDAVYRYGFDSSPDTVPGNAHTVQGTEVTVPLPGDGLFYLHLQLVNGGPVVHYAVRADRTPPSITDMQLSSDQVVAGDVVRFTFAAEDVGSGVQQNYYVDVGNHLFLPIGSQLFIPFLEAGNQQVKLRVYDNAGNYSEQSRTIHVAAP